MSLMLCHGIRTFPGHHHQMFAINKTLVGKSTIDVCSFLLINVTNCWGQTKQIFFKLHYSLIFFLFQLIASIKTSKQLHGAHGGLNTKISSFVRWHSCGNGFKAHRVNWMMLLRLQTLHHSAFFCKNGRQLKTCLFAFTKSDTGIHPSIRKSNRRACTVEPRYPDTWFSRHSIYHVTF